MKTKLLQSFSLFILSLIGSAFAVYRAISHWEKDRFRAFMAGIWIVIFLVSAIVYLLNYIKIKNRKPPE